MEAFQRDRVRRLTGHLHPSGQKLATVRFGQPAPVISPLLDSGCSKESLMPGGGSICAFRLVGDVVHLNPGAQRR
jgi:hypothetical protein